MKRLSFVLEKAILCSQKLMISMNQGSGNIENWIGPADDVIT